MRVITAPNEVSVGDNAKVLFLAGTIDMGNSFDWQCEVAERLSDMKHLVLLNPRRDSWDSSWIQRKSNPQFNEQVTWEMDGLESSDLIFMHLEKTSKSPISLLELGLHAADRKLIVSCSPEFYRFGNIEMVCDRYDIPLYYDFDDAVYELRTAIGGI